MKSGNLNFLEPSGPLQACNGTALPAYLQSCEKRHAVSSCLSVRPHGTTRLPLDGFSRNFVLSFLLISVEEFKVVQGGSNMTGTDLCVNKPHYAAAVRP